MFHRYLTAADKTNRATGGDQGSGQEPTAASFSGLSNAPRLRESRLVLTLSCCFHALGVDGSALSHPHDENHGARNKLNHCRD